MKQTLFYLPHELFEGWLLALWLVIGAAIVLWHGLVRKNWSEAIGFLPIYLVIAALIHFVFPRLESTGIDPDNPLGPPIPIGLAIRGYGVFMLLAILAGLGLAWIRCRQIGYSFDRILSIAFWMVIAGLIGARAFYVIQKWDEFQAPGQPFDFWHVVDMTKGGLVVYGSLIGGLIGAWIYLRLHQLRWHEVGDVLAPSLALGLAIGRLGCLMNGCCFGGTCQPPWPGLAFPAGSPPYMQQLVDGRLLGLDGKWEEGEFVVQSVQPQSLAETRGIQPGDRLAFRFPPGDLIRAAKPQGIDIDLALWIESPRLGNLAIPLKDLPAASAPIHPTQIYSAVHALLLALLLWFYYPFRRHSGEVLALLLILYPIGRFVLEIIRNDELGQLGTTLTISQLVSLATIVVGLGLMVYLRGWAPQLETAENG